MVWRKLDSSLVPGLALTLALSHGTGRAEPHWMKGKFRWGSLSLPPPAGKLSHALSDFWHHSAKRSFIHSSSFPSFPSPSLPLPPPGPLSSSFSLFLNIPEDNVFSMAPGETLSPAVAR